PRLARARRPDHHHVVPAGGDPYRPLGTILPLDVDEVLVHLRELAEDLVEVDRLGHTPGAEPRRSGARNHPAASDVERLNSADDRIASVLPSRPVDRIMAIVRADADHWETERDVTPLALESSVLAGCRPGDRALSGIPAKALPTQAVTTEGGRLDR